VHKEKDDRSKQDSQKRTSSIRKEPDPPKKPGEPFKNQNMFAALADEN